MDLEKTGGLNIHLKKETDRASNCHFYYYGMIAAMMDEINKTLKKW